MLAQRDSMVGRCVCRNSPFTSCRSSSFLVATLLEGGAVITNQATVSATLVATLNLPAQMTGGQSNGRRARRSGDRLRGSHRVASAHATGCRRHAPTVVCHERSSGRPVGRLPRDVTHSAWPPLQGMSRPSTLGHREPICPRTRVIQSRLRGAEVTHSVRPYCAVGCGLLVFLRARGQSPSRAIPTVP
jgi:hypothetical protein